jgi:hypothetical protein
MAESFHLREQAERCRRLARSSGDVETEGRLLQLAAEYDKRADVEDVDGFGPVGRHAAANRDDS